MGGKRLTSSISEQIFGLINSISLKNAVDRITQKEITDSNSGIITTAEEIKAYNIIKTIIAMSSKIKNSELERITFRDMKGSFAILVDDNARKKICSLVLTDKKKTLDIGDSCFDLEDTSTTSLTTYKRELVNSALNCLEN